MFAFPARVLFHFDPDNGLLELLPRSLWDPLYRQLEGLVAELKKNPEYPAPEQRRWLEAFRKQPGMRSTSGRKERMRENVEQHLKNMCASTGAPSR